MNPTRTALSHIAQRQAQKLGLLPFGQQWAGFLLGFIRGARVATRRARRDHKFKDKRAK